MPVIQLPKDTRYGDIGAGLGNLIGSAIQAYQANKTSEGVAQIMSDPSIAESDKQSQAYKKFGVQGGEIYKQFIASQVLGATIQEKKAEAAKNLAAVGQQTGREDIIRQLFGLPASGATAAGGGLPASTQSTLPATTTAPTVSSTSTPPTPSTASVLSDSMKTTSSTEPTVNVTDTPLTPARVAPAPTTPSPSPIVSALGGTPTAVSTSPIERMIDQRAAAGGVTFTPEEKQALVLQTAAHLRTTNGLSEIMAPTDKAIEQKQKGTKFPIEVETAASNATTAAAGATTSVAKAGVDLEKANQELAALKEKAPFVGPRAAAETQTAQQTAAASAPVKMSVEQVAQSFPTFSPEQQQAVALAGQTGGAKAAAAEVSKQVDANAKGAVTEATAKFARDAASYGVITERFAREMAAAPDKLGLLSGSGLRARAEAYGLPIGDSQLLSLLNSQKLAAATAARETGNWGVSGTNLTLSKQTSANIDKTAMSNIMMFAGTAAQKIKEAEVEKAVYEGNPRAQAVIDQAIQPWKNIQAMTDTLTSYVDRTKAIPGINERDVTYFMGNQVDPNTMRALVRQDATEYKVKPQGTDKRTSYTGEDIFALARAAGIDPAAMLKRLGGSP